MNDDAFARRFYADRAELESLGIELGVEKPGEGFFEAELYSLPPENFYLDAIEFSDDELAALSTALSLLTDGGFAYAEPLRLALQQVAWGHPQPARRGRAGPGRDGDDRLRRRPRPLPAPLEDRDRDLAPQDDRVHLLHDGARRHREAQGRSLPPRLPRRPVLFDRPRRTSATRCASSASRGSRARSATPRRRSTTSRRPRSSTAATTATAPTGSWARSAAPRRSSSATALPG